MNRQKSLRAELEKLRAELEEVRDKQQVFASSNTQRKTTKAAAKKQVGSDPEGRNHSLSDIESALKEIAELSESEIEKNPMLAIGVAFIAGLLIGRMSKR